MNINMKSWAAIGISICFCLSIFTAFGAQPVIKELIKSKINEITGQVQLANDIINQINVTDPRIKNTIETMQNDLKQLEQENTNTGIILDSWDDNNPVLDTMYSRLQEISTTLSEKITLLTELKQTTESTLKPTLATPETTLPPEPATDQLPLETL